MRGGDTIFLLPCLVMLQRVSRNYKGRHISENFYTNIEDILKLLLNILSKIQPINLFNLFFSKCEDFS